MKRTLTSSAVLAAATSAVAAGISLLGTWTASGFATVMFVAGLVVMGLGALGFMGGTAQMGITGGGSMGRGHEMLAETHARGNKSYAEQQGRDRAGRVSFAWTAMIAGIMVAVVSGLILMIQG